MNEYTLNIPVKGFIKVVLTAKDEEEAIAKFNDEEIMIQHLILSDNISVTEFEVELVPPSSKFHLLGGYID